MTMNNKQLKIYKQPLLKGNIQKIKNQKLENLIKKQDGFTVIELLTVLAIMGILITIVLTSFSQLNKSQALQKSARTVAAIINQARADTLSSKNDSEYGVHFETSQVVEFKGTTYSNVSPNNIYLPINPLVTLSNISIAGGGSEVTVVRLTGEASTSAVITLSLVSATTSTRVITVSGTGIVDVND